MGGTGINLHKYIGPNPQGTYFFTSVTANANTGVLSFSNISTMEVGQTVTGVGITANTVIILANTTANTITLSSNITSNISLGSSINISWRDGTQPVYTNEAITNIQDLLFLENRDRKYDSSIYALRGIYTVSDNDFDLKQFGIFLSPDTVLMTFHLNDMVKIIGRKILSGDVLELPHKKDYFPLSDDLPAALKRFYVVQDANFAADGFSPTWWPHIWRVKLTPLVNSQEYKDILNNIAAGDNTNQPLVDVMSNFNKLIEINDAIIRQAEIDVPKSGTNVDSLYIAPITPDGEPGDPSGRTVDYTQITADSINEYSNVNPTTPDSNVPAYLSGDGTAPNGWPVTAGTQFPVNSTIGAYVLRTDFVPNRLFRFDGIRWVKIEDNVRTNLTPGSDNKTQRSIFVNNNTTFTTTDGQTMPTRQSLSKALTPKADV